MATREEINKAVTKFQAELDRDAPALAKVLEIDDAVTQVWTSIVADARTGAFPVAEVNSFADLHNFLDANDYLVSVFPDFSVADIDRANEIIEAINFKIKSDALYRAVEVDGRGCPHSVEAKCNCPW